MTPATCMCDDASSRWRKEASSPVRRSVDMALKTTSEREAQLIVRQRVRCGFVEAGHTHPEQADGPARVEPPEQLQGDLADGPRVVHGRVDAAGAGDRAEVVEAHLDADRAAEALLAGERLAQLAGELVQDRLELVQPVQVAVEGGLARLGLGDPDRLDRAVVLE